MSCRRYQVNTSHSIVERAERVRFSCITEISNNFKAQVMQKPSLIDVLYKPNYAYANYYLNGNSGEAIAHSKVTKSTDDDFRAHWFIPRQQKLIYSTCEVGPFRNNVEQCNLNIWNRDVDSESKILEYFSTTFGNGMSGNINLYTRKIPCLSCDSVIYRFLHDNPDVNLDVYFEENDDYNCDIGIPGRVI
jgi:hypothetical protein